MIVLKLSDNFKCSSKQCYLIQYIILPDNFLYLNIVKNHFDYKHSYSIINVI